MSENKGAAKLADVLDGRSAHRNEAAPRIIEFGTIQSDGSLQTDSCAVSIPRADYHILMHQQLGAPGAVMGSTDESGIHTHTDGAHAQESGSGEHTHSGDGTHSHALLVPGKLRSPAPGDRVLVVWVGSDAVVVGVIAAAQTGG